VAEGWLLTPTEKTKKQAIKRMLFPICRKVPAGENFFEIISLCPGH